MLSQMLRRINWLSVRLFAGWLASVVACIGGVRLALQPVVDNTAGRVVGYAVLLFGFLLLGAWFRWCTRVSAQEALRGWVCECCDPLNEELDREIQERILSYTTAKADDLARVDALADTVVKPWTDPLEEADPAALSGHGGLLTHDHHVTVSEEDTGRHWRLPS